MLAFGNIRLCPGNKLQYISNVVSMTAEHTGQGQEMYSLSEQ